MYNYEDLIPQSRAIQESWTRLKVNKDRLWDLYGYDIGLHPLNMSIGGIVPTRLTVIGGRSGTGKSACSTFMLDASLRRKVDGSRLEYLFFTWELDPSILIDRSICSQVGVTLRQLNQGAKLLSEKAITQIKAAYDLASKFPITYHTYSTNIKEVKAISLEFVKRCREKSKVEGAHVQPVIVIDYLNMAQFDDELRTYGIGEFMNGLKQFCNNEKAACIVFAQLKRETDRAKAIPDRADFSDSAAIENAADNLIVLYRPEYHNIGTINDPVSGEEVDSRNKILVRVLKCRDYGMNEFLINCDIRHFRMWDLYQERSHQYFKDYSTEAFWINEFGLKPKETPEELPF